MYNARSDWPMDAYSDIFLTNKIENLP